MLCGKRTVSRVLRVMGLDQEQDYCNYYRMLSRVEWRGLVGAQILFGLIVTGLVSTTVLMEIDEHWNDVVSTSRARVVASTARIRSLIR